MEGLPPEMGPLNPIPADAVEGVERISPPPLPVPAAPVAPANVEARATSSAGDRANTFFASVQTRYDSHLSTAPVRSQQAPRVSTQPAVNNAPPAALRARPLLSDTEIPWVAN